MKIIIGKKNRIKMIHEHGVYLICLYLIKISIRGPEDACTVREWCTFGLNTESSRPVSCGNDSLIIRVKLIKNLAILFAFSKCQY